MTDDIPRAASNLAKAFGLDLDQENWSWTRRYNPGLYEHIHALGVIAANYNCLETELRLLLDVFMGEQMSSVEAGAYLFDRLNNVERVALLKRLYGAQVSDTKIADRLDWFVSGYLKCAENRNLLMHSEPHGAAFNALHLASVLELRKASKKTPGVHGFISLDLRDLRQVADDIDRFDAFGFDLALFYFASKRGGKISVGKKELSPLLPDKPALPIQLKLGPETSVEGASAQPEP